MYKETKKFDMNKRVSGMSRMPFRIRSIFMTLVRRGFSHTLYLAYIYSVSPYIVMVLPRLSTVYKKNKLRMEKYFFLNRNINNWRRKKDEILELGRSGYLLALDEIEWSAKQLEAIRRLQESSREVVIAEIDQDGFLLSNFGAIRNLSMVSKDEFLDRKKFTLRMVAIERYVGVKKDYRGNKLAFLKELSALHNLGLAGCNVPAIIAVDFDNLTLTCSYILGAVLRDELAKRGAILRDRDVENSTDFARLDPSERWLRRIQEGKQFLYDVVDSQLVENLFEQLRKTHEAGFIWNDIKYGNVIIEEKSGSPYLIDFDRASHYKSLPNSLFRVLRDQEIERFNLHFDTQEMTYDKMKKEIEKTKKNGVYAPVYFCAGLRLGDLWINKVGYGRWHYILKQNLPSLTGKRILDLGANNAFNSMQMLRNEAREAIGIELSEKNIKQGRFIKKGIEWTDNRTYNFKYIHANMKDIVEMELGRFDMVLALCSIYYLDDDSIANLVQFISTITNILILQCNIETNIDRSDPHTYKKATVEYNIQILKDNGFPFIQVIAPYRYSRPLLVAKKKK